MNNKVYYGEYSLAYWIKLIISGDLILPDYQRSFVWNEKDAKRLIESLMDKQFIQPLTIAFDGQGHNIILDGQQRLTSVLLASIERFPIKDKFDCADQFLSEDDGALDENGNTSGIKKSIKWTFSQIIANGKLKDISSDTRYKVFVTGIPDKNTFFEDSFIGFSYIIPNIDDAKERQRFFSKLFRNMNYLGQKLSVIESRRSLYYMDDKYLHFLEGETDEGINIFAGFRIRDGVSVYEIDLIKYLSILSQVMAGKEIMVGYSAYGRRESFYTDYVSYLMGLEQEDKPDKFDGFSFSTIEDDLSKHYEYLLKFLNQIFFCDNQVIKEKHIFKSVIDSDYWLFGLIFYIVFKKKQIDFDKEKLESLKKEISTKIEEKKDDSFYQRSPNRLGNLRSRVRESIEVYGKLFE